MSGRIYRPMNNYNAPYQGEIIYPPVQNKANIITPPTSFFGILLDKSAYKSIFYIFLFFVVSIASFVYTVTMLSLSLGLAVTIFGLPLAFLFLNSIPIMINLQVNLSCLILDVPMPVSRKLSLEGSFWNKLFQLIDDRRVQMGIITMIVMFPVFIAIFVMTVVGTSVSFGFIATVFYPLVRAILYNSGVIYSDNVVFHNSIFVLPEWFVIGSLVVLGILILTLTLHFAKFIAYNHTKLLIKLTEMEP